MENAFVWILCFVFISCSTGGTASIGRGSSWLQFARLELRGRRAIEMMKRNATSRGPDAMHNSKSNACRLVKQCHHGDAMRTLGNIMLQCDLKQIYPNSDVLCAPRVDIPVCRLERCHNEVLRAGIESEEATLSWICENRFGFEEADQCFQDPFKDGVKECIEAAESEAGTVENYSTIVSALRECVSYILDELEPCSHENKELVLSFFDAIVAVSEV